LSPEEEATERALSALMDEAASGNVSAVLTLPEERSDRAAFVANRSAVQVTPACPDVAKDVVKAHIPLTVVQLPAIRRQQRLVLR
jgi:hypothetical protein